MVFLKRSFVNEKKKKEREKGEGATAGPDCSLGKQPPQSYDCSGDFVTTLTVQARVGGTK